MVRLKVWNISHCFSGELCFNSTVVRLKGRGSKAYPTQTTCFNSTVVRLKAWWRTSIHDYVPEFQFHSGSIKRVESQLWSEKPKSCFNSTVVRLKVARRQATGMLTRQFQFHSGSIKSFKLRCATSYSYCFNSTVVRLKALPFVCVDAPNSPFQFHSGSIKSRMTLIGLYPSWWVSIPQWFD